MMLRAFFCFFAPHTITDSPVFFGSMFDSFNLLSVNLSHYIIKKLEPKLVGNVTLDE